MESFEIHDVILDRFRTNMPIGIVSDIDGTLSPISPTPDTAIVGPRSRAALETLCQRIALVAACSGRAAQDAHDKIGLDCMVYVGNHGFERWQRGQVDTAPAARDARIALANVILALKPMLLPGMLIEDKGATFSVHYRLLPDPDYIEKTFYPVIEKLAHDSGLVVFQGRRVFEVRPAFPINKGTALRTLVEEYHLGAVVFLGDDTTDVDAMKTARALRESGECQAYSVGVVSPEAPAIIYESADALVKGVVGVEDWLEEFVSALIAS
jgi:trehalose 6-phosphate phosphatase